MEEILHELDRFTHATAQLEAVPLGDLVEQTVALLPEFPDLEVRIRVDPALKNQHYVLSIGFMLKHVLHNLFVNAYEAIIAADKRQGTIDDSLVNKTVDGLAMADLQIRDDGIGIAPENIQEIFVRGFTTKKRGGRRGTGLHWCANRVIAMGVKLYAESPGLYQGATLHLLLPLAAVSSPVAAQ
jgi:signal transduction histidine kinase